MATGFVHKHMKFPYGAPDRRPWWTSARKRLRTAVTRRAAGYGLSAGGVGASLTAVVTHQASTIAIVVAGVAVVVGFVTKCVECYFQHRKAIIEAKGKAAGDQILAEAKAQSRKLRDETQRDLMVMAAEDEAKAHRIERMLALQQLAALADTCELTGNETSTVASLLAGYSPAEQPRQDPPDDEGGEFPRAV